MNNIDNLNIALQLTQFSVIGLFEFAHGEIECVVEEDEHTFTTISVGSLLGISTDHRPKSEYSFIKFPEEYKTLGMFLNKPFEFKEWYDKNFN